LLLIFHGNERALQEFERIGIDREEIAQRSQFSLEAVEVILLDCDCHRGSRVSFCDLSVGHEYFAVSPSYETAD